MESEVSVSSEEGLKKVCIICNKISNAKIVAKFRMRDKSRAEKFLKIANYLNDNVLIRDPNLKTSQDVLNHEVFYHSACLENGAIASSRFMSTSDRRSIRPLRIGITTCSSWSLALATPTNKITCTDTMKNK